MTLDRLTQLDADAVAGPAPIGGDLVRRPRDTAFRFLVATGLVVVAVALLLGAVSNAATFLTTPDPGHPGGEQGTRIMSAILAVGSTAIAAMLILIAWLGLGAHLRQLRRIRRMHRFAVANGLVFLDHQSGQHLHGPAFDVAGNIRFHSPLVQGTVRGRAFELGEYAVLDRSSVERNRFTEREITRFTYLSLDLGTAVPTLRLHSRSAPRLRRPGPLRRAAFERVPLADELARRFTAYASHDDAPARLAEPRLQEALAAHADRVHVELHETRCTLITRPGEYADARRLRALLAAGDAIGPPMRDVWDD